MLSGKNIVIGVTGGIASYKICEVVSRFRKLNANVDVIMTKSATEFVAPLTFQTLSQNRVVTDMFERSYRYDVEHISLAKKADLFLVAPATANFIAKFAHGIADDMLSTTVLATKAPILIVPSMNTNMYENAAVQENLSILNRRGILTCEPAVGLLACGDVGRGKLPEPQEIVERAVSVLLPRRDFAGKRCLVTAGGTSEPIDAVRSITNRSSGKMGMAVARALIARGAHVTVVAGAVTVPCPMGAEFVPVATTQEMYDAVLKRLPENDIVIKAAAPSDYRPQTVVKQKIKSESLTLNLVKNPDIAKAVGEKKGNKRLVIFCAETENLLENAKKKLVAKNADLIVANDVTADGAGFCSDTNIVTLIDRTGKTVTTDKLLKTEIADLILNRLVELMREDS